jgi:hypothetical protein
MDCSTLSLVPEVLEGRLSTGSIPKIFNLAIAAWLFIKISYCFISRRYQTEIIYNVKFIVMLGFVPTVAGSQRP